MKNLLSLPSNLVNQFYQLEKVSREDYFCTSDPVGHKLGSGGGTIWLLEDCFRHEQETDSLDNETFESWLSSDKRILLHAGGQSRRLPAYAPSGKVLTPVPIFRWMKGQKLSQNLLSLQLPLYKRIMEKAPSSLHTMIVSGDVYIRADERLQDIPEADVVCYGLWADPELATHHGVFVSSRHTPGVLECMLQKPSIEQLTKLAATHLTLLDIGVWLLSDKAIKVLRKRAYRDGKLSFYDLYSDFGCALGTDPGEKDADVNALKVAILPLSGGRFYHFGTTHELISSTLAIQNLVTDQREILQRHVKAHPAMFIQNAICHIPLTADNSNLWIENSYVGSGWSIENKNLITGVPENNWHIHLSEGVCIDVVPYGEKQFIARPYGFYDTFKGNLADVSTIYLGNSFNDWAEKRHLTLSLFGDTSDLQSANLFPIVDNVNDLGLVLRWMTGEPDLNEGYTIWKNAKRISAEEISATANLTRLFEQRESFRSSDWALLSKNYKKSVFYQVNLADAAEEFHKNNLPMPQPLPLETPLMTRIHDAMFRSQLQRLEGREYKEEEQRAFSLLREGLVENVLSQKQQPRKDVYSDQIVWARSPVRIDLAGGWTDTPPFCLTDGGNVVNVAVELNGQPPLQTFVKPCKDYKIILRSIDLGASEEVTTFEELSDFTKVGSPFSIPKAALVLAGFHPDYSVEKYSSLEEQLKAFGSGLEVTLLSAVPAGSGLGTSSILSGTVLGAISDFCGLAWDKNEICNRTLVLEQLLTTGGGWQDQYGGILPGIKLLQSEPGFDQHPLVRWLPDALFTNPEYRDCHLLYYTGITRTAKNILSEIVRGMFLNSTEHLEILKDMKEHALEYFDAVQRENFELMGHLTLKTWDQNKRLDAGTEPPAVRQLIEMVKDECWGYKLPGAGGGGFLYMIAKDPSAAARIRTILKANPINDRARFVDMKLSNAGLQISRS